MIMKGPFTSLFPKKPNSYIKEVYVTCSKTEFYSTYMKTDEQLFTNKKTEMSSDMYYVFNYEYETKRYLFKVLSKGNSEYELYAKYQVCINPKSPEKIWFEHKELLGFKLK